MADRTSAALPRSEDKLATADGLVNRIKELGQARQVLEREWKLNIAFYRGNQYAIFNRRSGRLESLPTDDYEVPRNRVRVVSNQIVTGVHSLVSKMTKTKPVWAASPATSQDADIKAAQLAERLAEFWYSDFNLLEKTVEALIWAINAQGYWRITWDPQAGKTMRFTLDPDGNPIVDDGLKDVFEAQLRQYGIQPMEKTISIGEIKVEVMSPFDVWLGPAKSFAEVKEAYCAHYMTPEEVKFRFKIDVEPDAIPTDYDIPLSFSKDDRPPASLKKVYVGYFVPGLGRPRGRYVVFIEGPNKILYDGPWHLPFNEIPLIQFPGIVVPGRVYDDADTTHARPIQKELNKTLSQIVQYKNLTVNPQMKAPIGSLRQRPTTEPGAVHEYQPIGTQGLGPEWQQMPALPPYLFDFLNEIQARLDRVYSLREVTEGSVPPNVEAGIAIDLLQEMATDVIAPRVMRLENALSRAGQMMLKLAQAYYEEPRLLKISGSTAQTVRFTKADLGQGVDLVVEAGSGLPRTRAGRQARIESLIAMQQLPPSMAWKHLDLADMKSVAARFRADEDKAYREIDKINQGEILNAQALEDAQMAIQSGINPETGQPLDTPEQIPDILRKASLMPGVADNHGIHLETLGMYMKGPEFEALPTHVQRMHAEHWMLHQQMQPNAAPENTPRVNLQLKGTLGPTTAAKILQTSGVQTTPEEMTEAPLETWVTDSMDKPDMDDAGNDPLTDQEMQLANIAKTEQEFAKARKANADADLAEKKARAPLPTSRSRGT